MKCPSCQSACLPIRTEEDVASVECSHCHGRWIPSWQFWRWLQDQGEILPELPRPGVGSAGEDVLKCLECGDSLSWSNAGRGLSFRVARCGTCSGLWMSQEVWESLKEHPIQEQIHSIFSTIWRRETHRRRATPVEIATPEMPSNPSFAQISTKKRFYSITETFSEYLSDFGRLYDLPPIYEYLREYESAFPLSDKNGNDTLWETVVYDPMRQKELNEELSQIYSILKTGEPRMIEHIYIERVDFCEFGNSKPFRVRVVNQFNDNYDHFYVKIPDASRIYGLELEHILSPNRINYLANSGTLIEEHIAGIPGDVFIRDHLISRRLNRVRVAKEFVKFNERSFVRLLGDMRSYNYVVELTPDFEETQYRVRAIDFDQQCYEGDSHMYLPQFFKENNAVVKLCTDLLNYKTMQQYQYEERTLISRRVRVANRRLNALLTCMRKEELSRPEKVTQLREGLNEYHETNFFARCETMGDLVLANIEIMVEKAQHPS